MLKQWWNDFVQQVATAWAAYWQRRRDRKVKEWDDMMQATAGGLTETVGRTGEGSQPSSGDDGDELRARLAALETVRLPEPPTQEDMDRDLTAMVRAQLKGLDVNVDFFASMQEDTKAEFLGSAHKVFTEPAFKRVMDVLKNRQIEFSMLQAEDWEGVKFGRATINGIALVIEEFEELSAAYLETVQPKEKFDAQSIT